MRPVCNQPAYANKSWVQSGSVSIQYKHSPAKKCN